MLAEGTNQRLTAGQAENLRVILERTQNRPVEAHEALEVGQALLTFYETLADSTTGVNA